MQAPQLHLIAHHERLLAIFRARNDLASCAQKKPFVQLALHAEANHARAQAAGPGRNDFVVRIQYRNIGRCLIHKDPLLCGGIVGQGFVTVHVIRRHVQHSRHGGMKIDDRLQLKARGLNHGPAIVARRIDH